MYKITEIKNDKVYYYSSELGKIKIADLTNGVEIIHNLLDWNFDKSEWIGKPIIVLD